MLAEKWYLQDMFGMVSKKVRKNFTGNWEWNSTRAVITNIAGNTLTLDRPTDSNYDAGNDGYVYRIFPMITNADRNYAGGMNEFHTAITVKDLALDQVRDDAMDPVHSSLYEGGPWTADFTVAPVHWEAVYRATVERVTIRNAAADAYSDQARLDDNFEANNIVRNCKIINSGRHAIHFGSAARNCSAIGNHIDTTRGFGVFLCAYAFHSVIVGNTFTNCKAGVAGGDTRDPEGNSFPSSPPADYDDVVGDIGTVIVGNTFVGGSINNPASLPNDSGYAVESGPKPVISGNMIMNYNGGIRIVRAAIDCVVSGNYIRLPVISTRSGIQIDQGAHHANITGNVIIGSRHSDTGVHIETANDVVVSSVDLRSLNTGITLSGDCERVTIKNCKIADIVDPWGPIRIFGATTDVRIDISEVDAVGAHGIISYNDGAGANAQTRLMLNNIGDNGTNDPSSAGSWNLNPATLANAKWDGTMVAWDDAGTKKLSLFKQGIGWITLN